MKRALIVLASALTVAVPAMASEALLKARPNPFAARGARLESIPGRPPDLTALPPGCSFAARCTRAQPDCIESIPPLVSEAGRRHACFHPITSAA